MPASWIQSMENLGVLFVSTPIALVMIYLTEHRLGVLYIRKRIFVGMIFAALSLLTAGILESIRLRVLWGKDNHTTHPQGNVISQIVENVTYEAADISIFWTIPQFVLLGSAEMFIFIPAIEYTYLSSVPWLQCTSVGVIWAAGGVGTLLGGSLQFGLDNVLFNLVNINYRRPCSTPTEPPAPVTPQGTDHTLTWNQHNLSSNFSTCDLYCWESRLDYLYYTVFLIYMFGICASGVITYQLAPSILTSSYIALEEHLQGEDEDDWEDGEDSQEQLVYYIPSLRIPNTT